MRQRRSGGFRRQTTRTKLTASTKYAEEKGEEKEGQKRVHVSSVFTMQSSSMHFEEAFISRAQTRDFHFYNNKRKSLNKNVKIASNGDVIRLIKIQNCKAEIRFYEYQRIHKV